MLHCDAFVKPSSARIVRRHLGRTRFEREERIETARTQKRATAKGRMTVLTVLRLSSARERLRDRPTQKNELLRLCARIGFTPPGVLQHRH